MNKMWVEGGTKCTREWDTANEREGEVVPAQMSLPQRWEPGESERKDSEARTDTPAGAEDNKKIE